MQFFLEILRIECNCTRWPQDFGHVMKQFGHQKENKQETEVTVGSKVDYARYGVSTSQWNYNVKLMLIGWETFINFKQDTGVN